MINQALKDKHFISTRPHGDAEELIELINNHGGTVTEVPMIRIDHQQLTTEESKELAKLDHYNWVIFTSSNGVKHFAKHLEHFNNTTSLPSNLKVASIGQKTSKTIEDLGWSVDFTNPRSSALSLAQSLSKYFSDEEITPSVLFPTGQLSSNVLQANLKHQTAIFSRIHVYKTIILYDPLEEECQTIINSNYDAIICASPSAVNSLCDHLEDKVDITKLKIACIGETTAHAVHHHDIEPFAVAKESSSKGIVKSLIKELSTVNIEQ